MTSVRVFPPTPSLDIFETLSDETYQSLLADKNWTRAETRQLLEAVKKGAIEMLEKLSGKGREVILFLIFKHVNHTHSYLAGLLGPSP